MFKKFLKLTAIFSFIFLLSISSVYASGKMEVVLGEKIILNTEARPNTTYKWVIKKGKEIFATQTNPIFSYTFTTQGEYIINLIAVSDIDQIKNTNIFVLAGDRYPRPSFSVPGQDPAQFEEGMTSFLDLSFTTLPKQSSDGSVHLLGEGRVVFNFAESIGDILEYRIDRNIFKDSDGDGVANNDIDNINDDSYLIGGSWQTEYQEGEATKVVAEITAVARDGNKVKKQVEILFDTLPEQSGDPIAVLETTPPPDSNDQLVRLYGDKARLAFYARRSSGKILEYRIDKNIFLDSDSDGDPANDIDNLNDISFKTGDVWEVEYEKTDQQIIAQLITVGEGGKGSRIQKGIVFTKKPVPTISEAAEQGIIRLVADKDFVVKGDPINFTVVGLIQALDSYTFAWDFNNDGEVDKEIEGNNTVQHIFEDPGLKNITVTITDEEDNSGIFNLEILSKDAVKTMADFDFNAEGNTVKFTNKSTVAMNLANKKLDYTWNFADTETEGYEEQKDQIGIENPTYTYRKAGTYLVALTVADADRVTDIKSTQITIEQDLESDEGVPQVVAEEEKEVKEKAPKKGSIIFKILKVILYIILIIIILIILILCGFFIFLKVQHPDLIFDELVDEFKIKLLTILGLHEMMEEEMVTASSPKESTPSPEEVQTPVESEIVEQPEKVEEQVVSPQESIPPETSPISENLQEKEIIDGETADESQEIINEEPIPATPTEPSAEIVTEKEREEETPDDNSGKPDNTSGKPDDNSDKSDDDSNKDEPPSNNQPPSGGESPATSPPGDESLDKQDGPVPDWLQQ